MPDDFSRLLAQSRAVAYIHNDKILPYPRRAHVSPKARPEGLWQRSLLPDYLTTTAIYAMQDTVVPKVVDPSFVRRRCAVGRLHLRVPESLASLRIQAPQPRLFFRLSAVHIDLAIGHDHPAPSTLAHIRLPERLHRWQRLVGQVGDANMIRPAEAGPVRLADECQQGDRE